MSESSVERLKQRYVRGDITILELENQMLEALIDDQRCDLCDEYRPDEAPVGLCSHCRADAEVQTVMWDGGQPAAVPPGIVEITGRDWSSDELDEFRERVGECSEQADPEQIPQLDGKAVHF